MQDGRGNVLTVGISNLEIIWNLGFGTWDFRSTNRAINRSNIIGLVWNFEFPRLGISLTTSIDFYKGSNVAERQVTYEAK